MRFLLTRFSSPLRSFWIAAQTKSLGPIFPPCLCPMGLFQAGPSTGQNEGQLLTFLLYVQSLCHVKGLDSTLVRSPQNATSGNIKHNFPGRGIKKGILFVLSLGLLLQSWLVFTVFIQATAKQFNFWGTSESQGEVWHWARVRNWGKSYVGLCVL